MMYSNWNDSIHPSEEMNDDILEDLKVIGKTIDKQIDEDRFELDIDDLESNICIYPKQVLVNRSTVIRLNDEEVSNEETKTFLKIIEESGYSDLDNTQLTNWNCCIIQKDSNIIRLDFESELDYCAFVVHMKLWSYNVGKGARTGFCKIHDNIPSEARESFLFSKSLSTALFHFSPRNTEPYGWSKYILDKEILSIVDDSSNQILRIDVRNIIALILCKDYLIPVDYLLNIQLSFPSQVLFDSSQVKLKASTVLGDLIVAELGEWNQSVVGNSCNGFFCLSNTPTDKFQFTLEASDFDTNVPLLTKTIDCSLFLGDYLAQDTDNVTMAEDTCYFINKPRHISPKRINTDVHVSTSVQLQTENIGKVFRLVLVRACGINTAHGTIPSVYCVVYLIDKYGNRLSANKAQMRSIACKSNDPSWNKEFLLELSQQECQHTDHVMILLRDANSGILKHRHVGQVLIPLSCFLPELDANLCLPIEPSFRMDANDSQKSYLGEVNVITRLLIPSATTPRSKQSRNVADVNTLNERNNVTVRYRIFRCVASVTWWPFNLFYHDGKHERIGMNDCTEGFLLLGIESIILKRLRSNIHETIKYSDIHTAQVFTKSMVFIAFQDSCNNRDCAILVGPCPSTSFIRSFHFRHLHGKEMLTSLCALRKITRDTWSSKQEEIDFTNSKNSPKKLLTKSLSFRMLFQPNLNTLSAERSFENILSCGRTLCAALELYFHSAVRVKYDSSSLQYFSSYCKILLQIVEEIVINGACNVMREVGNHIVFLDKDRIKLKIADIYRETVSRDVKNLPCVFTRGDSILVHSGQFVEECIGYLRCCFLLVCSLPSQPMTVSTVVDCITNEVIHYLQVATSSSFESKANFLRTEGMELKQNLIIFLIRVNQMWAESVKSLRMLIGITTLPKENPLLLPPLNDVLGWFIVSIRQDIHIWMSKSIDHYNGNRENNYSLPWDVQQLGNQWCSDIPETVAMQLKVYSDFDFHDLDNEYPFCVSELKYFRTELNDSISRSWYFLLSELTQAMLCRHWDSADEDATIGAFSHFLMSIGNDFLRVLARFVPKDSKDNKDIDIIQSMTTILIGHMTKLIFSTTQTTLLHFDSTWNQEVGNGCSIFITNLSHHFKKMKPCLHSMLFREVVLSCMKVVVLRYLLLLKNKILLSFGRAMESSEVDRLIEDEGRLSAFFHGFLEESVLESLLYMRHLCVILKQDHNNPLFKDSLLWILRLYDLSDFKQVQFVEFLLLTCFLPLRMEATTEIYIYVATQIRHFTENYQYRARISLMQIKETDMYWRLFADFRLGWDEESRPSQTDGNRVEIDETVVHNSFPSVLGTFTNNLSVLKPSQFISSLKKIREKISDVKFPLPLAINGYAPNSKEYDEVAAYIMRSINLDQKDSPAHLELVRLLQTLYIGKTELELVEKPFDQLSEINRPALFYSSIVQQDHGDVPMLEAISTLIIERIELRNVASHSVIGKANPYIVFKFGDIVFKTAVKWDCENCVWTEKMQQTISNNLLLNQRLSINVYDKERIRRKRFIGGIELLLNPYINRAHASWYALESSEVIATEIFLSFRILS